MERERYEDVVDATRRTRLASERTYLAWWRSALAAFAVSLGVGKLVPELTSGRTLGYEIVGVGYALLGIALHRLRVLAPAGAREGAVEGRFVPFGRRAALGVHDRGRPSRRRDARRDHRVDAASQTLSFEFRRPGTRPR